MWTLNNRYIAFGVCLETDAFLPISFFSFLFGVVGVQIEERSGLGWAYALFMPILGISSGALVTELPCW